jgi:hypothetical protein
VSFKYVKWIILGRITKRVKVTLEQATKAQRGSRGIALLFPKPITKRVVIYNIFMKKLICWPIIVIIGLFQCHDVNCMSIHTEITYSTKIEICDNYYVIDTLGLHMVLMKTSGHVQFLDIH